MKIFQCPDCSAELFFDNLACACGRAVGYAPAAQRFVTDAPFCASRDSLGCNWTRAPGQTLCDSCRMTSVHPDLSVSGNDQLWARAEAAKRRTLAGLMRWGWFTADDPGCQRRRKIGPRGGAKLGHFRFAREARGGRRPVSRALHVAGG